MTSPGALQRAWRQVVTDLTTRIPARGTLLSNAVATSDNGTELVVSLPKGSSFALKMLERPDIKAVVEQSVAQAFGQRTLVFKEGTDSTPQPSARQQQVTSRSRAPQQPKFGHASAPAYATAPSPYADQQRTPAGRQTSPYARSPQAMRPNQPARPTQPSQPVEQAAGQPMAPASAPNASADYPLPWDNPSQPVNLPTQSPEQASEPAPIPSSAAEYDDPYYEAVPYEELGAFSPEPDAGEYAFEPEPEPAPAVTQPVAQIPQAAPLTSQQPATDSQQPAVAPKSSQQPARTASQGDVSASAPVDVLVGPDELPPELARVLEDAFEVFGSDVRASRGHGSQ
ncbi:MAG: hypothetical protein J6S63_05155 [Atopobiaceae bacterium]|nr:hypothetical protein [Atopobiaceae bacterium]